MTEKSQATTASTQANDVSAKAVASETTIIKDERTVYEVGFHLVPTIPEGELGGKVDMVRSLLTKEGAEIISEGMAQKMTFAYRIERSQTGKREKYTEGYFGWIKFAVLPGAVPAMSAALTNTHDVLRYLIIETTREDTPAPRRAVFASRSLEGKTIEKPATVVEKTGEVSEEELDKSIEALVA